MFEHAPFSDSQAKRLQPTPEEALAPPDPRIEYARFMHEQLQGWWDAYGLQERVESLAEFLGSSQMVLRDFSVAPGVPGLINVGARIKECFSALPINGTDIAGLTGNVVFYRTRQSSKPESFKEAGFFVFLLAVPDTTGQTVRPSLVYGDIDAAQWSSEAAKLQFFQTLEPHMLRGQDVPTSIIQSRDVNGSRKQQKIALTDIQSVFGTEEYNRRRRIPPGALRQNEIPLLGDSQAAEVWSVGAAITVAMQAFIDTHYLPDQTKSPLEERSTQSDPLPVCVDRTCRQPEYDSIMPWRYFITDEFMELPYIKALSKAGWSISAPKLFPNSDLSRVISDLHTGLSIERAPDLWNREELTDEEIIAVHKTYPKVLTQVRVGSGISTKHLSGAWIEFLERFPDLYPGVTEDTILEEYDKHN